MGVGGHSLADIGVGQQLSGSVREAGNARPATGVPARTQLNALPAWKGHSHRKQQVFDLFDHCSITASFDRVGATLQRRVSRIPNLLLYSVEMDFRLQPKGK